MNCSGIILSGGASRRMGRAKALLPLDGETFLDRLTGILEPYCSEIIVVLGHHSGIIREGMRRTARIVVNPDPERGQLSSLQCALAAMDREVDAFFFTPVDYPAIMRSTVAGLVAALNAHSECVIAIPQHGSRHGHPVLCRASLAADFLQLPAEARASDVVHRYVDGTIYVPVADSGTVSDVDDPSAYEKLVASRQ